MSRLLFISRYFPRVYVFQNCLQCHYPLTPKHKDLNIFWACTQFYPLKAKTTSLSFRLNATLFACASLSLVSFSEHQRFQYINLFWIKVISRTQHRLFYLQGSSASAENNVLKNYIYPAVLLNKTTESSCHFSKRRFQTVLFGEFPHIFYMSLTANITKLFHRNINSGTKRSRLSHSFLTL